MTVTLEEKGEDSGSEQLVMLMVLIRFSWAKSPRYWNRRFLAKDRVTETGKNVFGRRFPSAIKGHLKILLWDMEWTAAVFVCSASICHLLLPASLS